MKLYRFTLVGIGGTHTYKYLHYENDQQAIVAGRDYVERESYAQVHIHRHRNFDTCGIVDFVATYPERRQ